MSDPSTHRLLRKAARLCGVATSYRNYNDERVNASDSALIHMINALQEDVALSDPVRPEEVKTLIGKARQQHMTRGLPPVIIAWDGHFSGAWLWLNGDADTVTVSLRAEEGQRIGWTQSVHQAGHHVRREGRRVRLVHGAPIAFGYYTMEVRAGDRLEGSSFLIAAPRKPETEGRHWGLFAPAYGLKTGSRRRDWRLCRIEACGAVHEGNGRIVPRHAAAADDIL